MMFRLSILTPERVVYDAEVHALVAPGAEGYLGILSQHAPIITLLGPGKIEFHDVDKKLQVMAVSKGFLEVSSNVATLLADAVERPDDIDIERARAAYKRALGWLAATRKGKTGVDLLRAQAARARAANRITIYEETH